MAEIRFNSRIQKKIRTFGQVNKSIIEATTTRTTSVEKQSIKNLYAEQNKIEVLPEYRQVKKLIDASAPLIFVTGSAGTGKSTFIKWLEKQYRGKILLCAPTGIAALTIGGKTIHSLCKFPPSWIIDKDIKQDRKSLAKHAKLLVIDEVSMVNANLLDSIDKYFRMNRDSASPFGGVSVVMVGDLFQLPPIVTRPVKHLFQATYSSPGFYAAHSLSECEFHYFELTKAFRQVDQNFVNLLSNIREGNNIIQTVKIFNESCKITKNPEPGAISLAPTHLDIDRVNFKRLESLKGKEQVYNGVVTGRFLEKNLPAPISIKLKIGAQVMLIKNSKKYINGDVALVTSMSDDRIQVSLLKSREIVEVPVATWEQFDYKLNEKTKEIEKVIIGTYVQIPVILAWAITIHKSQGLTLERVHLDLGSGAFETGQTYVALSRCRSLETLSLERPIKSSDIRIDRKAKAFYDALRR